jgi:hypothetical protein
LWLANRSGVYALFGATPQKVSDALDGVFQLIDFTGGETSISGGLLNLKNILCVALMFQYTDGDSTRPLIAIYFNKKWYLASQGDDLIHAMSAQQGGLARLYATDGTYLYRLFDDVDKRVPWTIKTALWDMDDVGRGKQVIAFGFEVDSEDNEGQVRFTIDSKSNNHTTIESQSYDVDVFGYVQWANNSSQIVDWINNANNITLWSGSVEMLLMQDGSNMGKYVGVTMESSTVRGSISSIMLRYIYRESW